VRVVRLVEGGDHDADLSVARLASTASKSAWRIGDAFLASDEVARGVAAVIYNDWRRTMEAMIAPTRSGLGNGSPSRTRLAQAAPHHLR
jgi:hypothetical protein